MEIKKVSDLLFQAFSIQPLNCPQNWINYAMENFKFLLKMKKKDL